MDMTDTSMDEVIPKDEEDFIPLAGSKVKRGRGK
jgi:hypothetical protein